MKNQNNLAKINLLFMYKILLNHHFTDCVKNIKQLLIYNQFRKNGEFELKFTIRR